MSNPKYLYIITYSRDYEELCKLEMTSIFGEPNIDNYFLTSLDIPVSRSTFIKGRINVSYMATSLIEMENQMKHDKLAFNDYKIQYVKYDKDVAYKERLAALRQIGFSIIGNYAMQNPKTSFALTKLNNQWIFGQFEKDLLLWETRKNKPYNYTHAIEVKLARSIVNIAIDNDFSKTVADVCCGIGTVVIEGRDLGVNITGYELNKLVAWHANANLLHFCFKNDIIRGDMLDISKTYDVAILDMPYGLFSLTTKDAQKALIQKTRQLSKRAIIIAMEDMSQLIESTGFKIINTCTIYKSTALSRIVSICE